MSGKHYIWATALLGGILLMAGPGFGATDCEAVKAAITKERSLLKQSEMLEGAIASCPDDPEINYKYGYVLERLRKYEEALTYYKAAAKLDKNVAKYHFGQGDIYLVLEDVRAAIKAYETGLRLEPENSRASRSLEAARVRLSGPTETATARTEAPVVKETVDEAVAEASAVQKTPVPVKEPEVEKVAVKPVNGPTLKPEQPDLSDFAELVKALEQEDTRSRQGELAAVPGGGAFRAERLGRLEAMGGNARLDAEVVDPQRLLGTGR